ncbi:hypothetical protein KC363_g4609 [Hortaea werneckii]|nr:hypothetical protein KC361_g8952 [Hortaea werneckii]KAI6998701.1 hypothetical protein KC359_g2236 [Hortaea werneckii]KAI7146895.1 hypothetical protein KC344_g3230 [Hortaea werneckii]KAI7179077.1 hypothetical protein KC360_g1093 [Hortaea werneckii]KAI7190054.1 hypothetical protein KC363_g4609 [Hortaea werneckii]
MAAPLRTLFADFVHSLLCSSYTHFKPQRYNEAEEDYACLQWAIQRARYRAALNFPSDVYQQYWLAYDFESNGIADKVRSLVQDVPSAARHPRREASPFASSAFRQPHPQTPNPVSGNPGAEASSPASSAVRQRNTETRIPLSGNPGAKASFSALSAPRAPRKRAPDTVDRCSEADTSSSTTIELGPLAKKSKRTHVVCESPAGAPDDPPLAPCEQLTKSPSEPSDETMEEQDRLSTKLARFVRSDGYLDHGHIM